MSQISEALIKWLDKQDDKDQVIMVSGRESYSASDMIREIEEGTDMGKKLEDSIIQLTIDLLFRKVESI